MVNTDTTGALTTIIKVLTPLNSEERHRAVDAAMVYLGEIVKPALAESKSGAPDAGTHTGDGGYSAPITKWMQQHDISAEALDQVFHFQGDSFDIHSAPGKSKREQTLGTYILTGVGAFLTTNARAFDDLMARGFCETIGCYDPANHAKYIKNKGSEFSGDKTKGYSLTNVGMKRGVEIVKEIAGAAK